MSTESRTESGTLLAPVAAFGLDTSVKNNVQHVDDNRILFPVGRHLASFDLQSREMNFILESDKVAQIISLSISQNRKYLGVIEELEGGSSMQVVISPSKRPTFPLP
ncbi:hypothetical protein CYMTET_20695, partial [Cymbomonas tetramitiformis]